MPRPLHQFQSLFKAQLRFGQASYQLYELRSLALTYLLRLLSRSGEFLPRFHLSHRRLAIFRHPPVMHASMEHGRVQPLVSQEFAVSKIAAAIVEPVTKTDRGVAQQ